MKLVNVRSRTRFSRHVMSSVDFVQLVAGIGLVVSIAVAMSNVMMRSHAVAVLACLAGWSCIVAYAGRFMRLRSLAFFIPLFLAFFFAAYASRRGGEIEIFFADSNRFTWLADGWAIEDRHFGWSLFAYVIHPFRSLGDRLGIDRLGNEILYWQSMFAGVIASALLYQAAGILRNRFTRALIAYAFGFSFAVWTVSMAADTYSFSVMFLLLHVVALSRWFGEGGTSPVALGCCTAAAMAVSFEAIYLPALVVAAFVLLRVRVRVPYRQLCVYIASVAVAFAALFLAYVLVRSFAGEFQSEKLHLHIEHYADVRRIFSVQTFGQIAASEFVSSVIAQRGFPIVTGGDAAYGFDAARAFTAANAAYVALLVPLLLLSAVGLFRQRDHDATVLASLALLLFVGRHAFMMMWAPHESLIFAPPSIAAIFMLVAVGARCLDPFSRARWLAPSLLGALVILLFVVNWTAIGEYY